MNVSVITLVVILCVIALVLINRVMIKEEDLLKKAEKNLFYHTLAKLTCPLYKGYSANEGEQKAIDEYLSKPSEYDIHPIGAYFKITNDLKSILKTAGNFHNYNLKFNLGEVGTGFAVFAVFALVVTLGVIYG